MRKLLSNAANFLASLCAIFIVVASSVTHASKLPLVLTDVSAGLAWWPNTKLHYDRSHKTFYANSSATISFFEQGKWKPVSFKGISNGLSMEHVMLSKTSMFLVTMGELYRLKNGENKWQHLTRASMNSLYVDNNDTLYSWGIDSINRLNQIDEWESATPWFPSSVAWIDKLWVTEGNLYFAGSETLSRSDFKTKPVIYHYNSVKNTWQNVAASLPRGKLSAYDINVANDVVVYATVGNQVYVSSEQGLSTKWRPLSLDGVLPTAYSPQIYTTENPRQLYLLASQQSFLSAELFVSFDAGENWQSLGELDNPEFSGRDLVVGEAGVAWMDSQQVHIYDAAKKQWQVTPNHAQLRQYTELQSNAEGALLLLEESGAGPPFDYYYRLPSASKWQKIKLNNRNEHIVSAVIGRSNYYYIDVYKNTDIDPNHIVRTSLLRFKPPNGYKVLLSYVGENFSSRRDGWLHSDDKGHLALLSRDGVNYSLDDGDTWRWLTVPQTLSDNATLQFGINEQLYLLDKGKLWFKSSSDSEWLPQEKDKQIQAISLLDSGELLFSDPLKVVYLKAYNQPAEALNSPNQPIELSKAYWLDEDHIAISAQYIFRDAFIYTRSCKQLSAFNYQLKLESRSGDIRFKQLTFAGLQGYAVDWQEGVYRFSLKDKLPPSCVH